jgi:hypothetical protein
VTRRRPGAIALAALVGWGCHPGERRGTGAACDDARPCPAHYRCVDARCVPVGPADAGPADAGPADAGPADAGPADAGPADAGPADTGPASVIGDISYEVRANPAGGRAGTICLAADPPDPLCSGRRPIDKCRGATGTCTITISWAGSFGGDGDLGADPCPFIVKDVLDVRYSCSHDGVMRHAVPDDFPSIGGPHDCAARSLGTATLTCP